VLTLRSVFSSLVVVLLAAGGFTTVVLVSFFSDGGFTTVVLLSFLSAGGLTVVVFARKPRTSPTSPTGKSIFSYQLNRIWQPFDGLAANGISAELAAPVASRTFGHFAPQWLLGSAFCFGWSGFTQRTV
jgi:hypothetical protein